MRALRSLVQFVLVLICIGLLLGLLETKHPACYGDDQPSFCAE